MKRTALLSVLSLGIMFASCTKNSDNPNPTNNNGTNAKETQMSYKMAASNKSATIAQKSTATAAIQWTAAIANPSLVKFEAKKGGTEIEYKSTNTAQVDLMNPVSFGSFTIPSGTYDEVELKIELDKTSTGPALRLSGQFSDGTVTIPVVFEVNEAIELKTEQHSVTIVDSSSFTAITTLDLSAYTAGITTSLVLGAQLSNGTLVISSSSNKNLYDIMLANLASKHHMEFEHHHK